MFTQRQVIRRICDYDPAELTLLLGAGASRSSGVKLGSDMIREWRSEIFESRATPEDVAAGLAVDDWFARHRDEFPDDDLAYSRLFEYCHSTPDARQKYIEKSVLPGTPGWGYLYLANMIVQRRRFTTVFTTNFDDLVNEALTRFLQHNAAVCNGDAEVDEVSFLSDRAKIVKLHGDYLFYNQKNTIDELRKVGVRMAEKFAELARARGLVVIGYSGRDESIMHMLELLFEDRNAFRKLVFWGVRRDDALSERVKTLSADPRLRLFECQDFDGFMEALHTELQLELPDAIVSPHHQVDRQLGSLVAVAERAPDGSAIRRHGDQLRAQLGRPIEAELALAQRDHRNALRLADRHIELHGPGAAALTVRGEALAIQAEVDGRHDLEPQAIAAFEQAIRADLSSLPARYGLARLLTRLRRFPEAIKACEELATKVPNDHGLRRNLVQLYMQVQRVVDAEREVAALIEMEGSVADLHYALSTVRSVQGRTQDAIAELEKAVELDPRNANLRFTLAQHLASTQRVAEAERQYIEGLKLDDDNPAALVNLGLLIMRRQPLDAATYFERAARANPGSADVHAYLAEFYLRTNRLQDAERSIRAALQLADNDARHWGVLANLLCYGFYRFDEAEQAFTQAHRLNPSMPQHPWSLGILALVRSDSLAFQQALQQLSQIDPGFAQQLQMQGPMLAKQLAQARTMRQFMPQQLLNQAKQFFRSVTE